MKPTHSVGFLYLSGFVLIYNSWTPVSGDSCLDAVNIGDYRRSVSSAPNARDFLLCDRNINEALWYRFDAFTGGKMPESCVSVLHCGTFLPIWMNDVHPTAAQPGPKTAAVCAPFWLGNGDCCQWRENILVRWCQNATTGKEYFVYQLKRPPFCSMSYCAGSGLPCARDCSWNGVLQRCSCQLNSVSSVRKRRRAPNPYSILRRHLPSLQLRQWQLEVNRQLYGRNRMGYYTRPAYPPMNGAPELKAPRIITGSTAVSDIYEQGRTFFPTRFVVDCEVRYPRQAVDDGARFDVVFEVNGHHLTHFSVSSLNPVATLDESFLVGHLGKELTCKVSAHWDSTDVGSRYLISNRRWFGFEPIDKTNSVVSGNLVVKEGEKVSLWMRPTFPITTRPCFDASHLPCLYSTYSLSVRAANDTIKLSDCAMIVHQNSTRSVELEIAPIPVVGSRPKPVIWQLEFDAYSDTTMNLPIPEEVRQQLTPIFKGYRIQSVNIEVRDRDDPPQCQSVGDPHITTFPNAAGVKNYYHVYGVGVYYLVRLQTRVFEIQVHHVPCGARYSCNCGVIAREGNSIIGITKCNQPSPLLIKYQLDKVSPSGTIHTTPEGWKISLLSGVVINVAGWGKEFMHLYVTALRSELTQYDGLCSASSVSRGSECTSNCDRYRVPAAHSFFGITQSNLPRCSTPMFVPTCSCYGRDAHGTRTGDSIMVSCDNPMGDYLLKIDLTRVCSKRKRQINNNDDDEGVIYDDLISLDDFNTNPVPVPTTTTVATTTTIAPTDSLILRRAEDHGRSLNGINGILSRNIHNSVNVLSLANGRERCRSALQQSFAHDLCSSRVNTATIVDTCALDVRMLNDYGPSKSAPTQFEIACLDSIRRSLETYASNDLRQFQELKALLSRVESLVCPSQCNQNGQCINSKCQCNAGYMGIDCSLRRGQVPFLQRIFSPLCDIHRHPCKQIHLVATDFTIPSDVVCRMRSVSGSTGDVPGIQYSTPVVSGGLVICNLPLMPISKDAVNSGMNTNTYLVQVSISNDGQTYSQELPFTVYDGRCMQCPASQSSPCQLKGNTCSIRGRCYRAGDRCQQNNARICNPSKCGTKWSSAESANCSDGFENCN